MPRNDVAIVLRIGDRFYCGKSKTGRCQTAWSIAGAKLFGEWNEQDILQAQIFIASRGKESERETVVLVRQIEE